MKEENENEEVRNDDQGTERAIKGMYEDWFLDYASYVILERAVPNIEDGLKPVQRRILHAMKEIDDGRYNKVANIIGATMQYHPHGDASIGDAIVNLGQKELLIDTQGNWGDFRTGDSAAAPRYIEARLTKFALEVGFNKQTTEWQKSYDGRKNEPVTLPIKFPLLLAQGVEGIAVGLSTRIMPHNFNELLKASIDILKGKKSDIKPDFPTGGMADFSDYNGGARGGRIRIRARIEERDKKTIIITEIPYGQTTTSVIDSIIKANDKGKIKIKKVVDNTAKDLEIEVYLAPGVSADKTIDALYAFTNCEVSISPNACVIVDQKPMFMDVNEILRLNTQRTVDLLEQELKIKKHELEEKWHFSSLEKIFIEERIYRDIEEAETWEEVLGNIDKGLEPHKKKLKRAVTEEDIVKLTEIRIKRISKYDAFKADELLKGIEADLDQVNHDLEHLVDYAIAWFKSLLDKYGKGRERLTEERTFDSIQAAVVAATNEKLYVNYDEGFVGTGLRKDTYICDCSDIDDIIVFQRNGNYVVSKVSDKAFFGKDIIHVDVWRKGDERMVYNCIYSDSASGKTFAKRFNVKSITRDKPYNVGKNDKDTKVQYFTANANGEAEVVTIYLHGLAKARKKIFDFDFADLAIKGRSSQGNTVSKYRLRKVDLKEKGQSTIGGRDIYYEPAIGRLNVDGRGELLGSFQTDDHILVIYQNGEYELTDHELTNHYDVNQVYYIGKYNPKSVITCIHLDGKQKTEYVKRFQIETSTIGKRFLFINEGRTSKLLYATLAAKPRIQLITKNDKKEKTEEVIHLDEFIDVKGWKSTGNKLTYETFVKFVELPAEDVDEEELEDDEDEMDEIEETPTDDPSDSGDEKPSTQKEVAQKDPPKLSSEDKKIFTSGDQLNLL
ncbi:MAG: DNA gyrase/topoisomerase IV subunit A [Flavobacteriales bacterium]|nr:DNA gyrase/topoisomerase IV subunit A [Bacteroidota bacterium]MCB9239666.1 DNA gyrase/topoisomerase IV subunit A [Flavobacteriales bacterium]